MAGGSQPVPGRAGSQHPRDAAEAR